MRKKSIRKSVNDFKSEISQTKEFLSDVGRSSTSEKSITWAHEYAVIRLYREFEDLMLNCLVASINNDTATLTLKTGVKFPKHLTDEICEYIVVGNGYFDFKGRDGLISELKKYVPDDHFLITAIKDPQYKTTLDRLSALRNFAAHDSAVAKRTALNAIEAMRLSSAGAWLKKQGRFGTLCDDLEKLADKISAAAPR